MKYYTFKKVLIEGPAGTVLDFRRNTENSEGDGSFYLGYTGGLHYVSAPDDYEPAPQDPLIEFTELETAPDDSIKLALRKGHAVTAIKKSAREKIESEVGDILDLLADTSSLTEFAVIACCALLARQAGSPLVTDEMMKTYADRALEVLTAVGSGTVTIRGSFEEPDAVISRIMPRYTRVQQIVRDDYVNRLREMGL